ncbi:MAG: malonyl-ACP O-methyltransferase BioC [Clostridium sp.]|jgi:malonyl-CoA O-methyltransferase|nr:malonyl-ACP O-methyltransferase BioC [Clostridium sp.]
MIDKEKLKRRFSRNARQYDKYAKVQKNMGDILIEKIKSTKTQYKNILEIGCGTGYVTKALCEHFKNSNITAIDIAPGMISHVKSKISDTRVGFICGDVEEMDFDKDFDLILSNAAFQWFNNLENTFKKLVKTLAPKGFMCFSTFGENTFIELKKCYEKTSSYFGIKDTIYPSQPFLSLKDYKKICSGILDKSHTLSLMETYEYEYFNCCKDFLYSIKKIGANNSQKRSNIVHPNFIDKVINTYDKDYRKDNKVLATYHNLFVFISKD